MCHTMEVINQRRSIRRYQTGDVPVQVIRKIFEAATKAPSAHNAQPWRFILITDKHIKHVLAEAMAKAWLVDLVKDGVDIKTRFSLIESSIKKFTTAPLLVLGCLTLKDMNHPADSERQSVERDLAVQSLAASIQNLLLAAQSEGIGTCWHCAPIFCKSNVRKALKIPDNVEPQALITLGFPDEAPNIPERKSLSEIVHLNEWGNSFDDLII